MHMTVFTRVCVCTHMWFAHKSVHVWFMYMRVFLCGMCSCMCVCWLVIFLHECVYVCVYMCAHMWYESVCMCVAYT